MEQSRFPPQQCWQWQVGAVAIVLAYLNLLADIRELGNFGIYVIMFFDILKTFCKFIPVLLVFLVAFGLGFHQLIERWGIERRTLTAGENKSVLDPLAPLKEGNIFI